MGSPAVFLLARTQCRNVVNMKDDDVQRSIRGAGPAGWGHQLGMSSRLTRLRLEFGKEEKKKKKRKKEKKTNPSKL